MKTGCLSNKEKLQLPLNKTVSGGSATANHLIGFNYPYTSMHLFSFDQVFCFTILPLFSNQHS